MALSLSSLCRAGLLVLATGVGACGDSILPSTFSGPPAATVSGSVLPGPAGTSRDAVRPRLDLQWLTEMDAEEGGPPPLSAQSVSFRRSARLAADWDIGLDLPLDTGHFQVRLATGTVHFSVAKIVYFDDRVPDSHLDWTCTDDRCDEVKAVSTQFVVFIQSPSTCQGRVAAAHNLLRGGYHYFTLTEDGPQELTASDVIDFTVSDAPLLQNDPTPDLQGFVKALINLWSLSTDGLPVGC